MGTDPWLSDLLDKTESKIEATCKRIGDKIPYIPIEGRYIDRGSENLSWWTNGFWGGILWQLYCVTGKAIYRKAAETLEHRIKATLDNFVGLHHDVGFLFLHTSVANFKLTGNEVSLKRGLHAANILAGRYNPETSHIVAWDYDAKCWLIIDTMMNLPLLYWAAKQSHSPRYTYMANSHADTVIEKLLRADGSCNHLVVLDHHTGEVLECPGGQGYKSGSSWSRGQAWALYGFVLSYLHTGKERYLHANVHRLRSAFEKAGHN